MLLRHVVLTATDCCKNAPISGWTEESKFCQSRFILIVLFEFDYFSHLVKKVIKYDFPPQMLFTPTKCSIQFCFHLFIAFARDDVPPVSLQEGVGRIHVLLFL
jgi:hypothetical protein